MLADAIAEHLFNTKIDSSQRNFFINKFFPYIKDSDLLKLNFIGSYIIAELEELKKNNKDKSTFKKMLDKFRKIFR